MNLTKFLKKKTLSKEEAIAKYKEKQSVELDEDLKDSLEKFKQEDAKIAQEEQKLMLRLVKPKFFLPVHGEYNHALKHAQTGIDCGVLERNVYIMSDGEQIEVSPKVLKKVKSVKRIVWET